MIAWLRHLLGWLLGAFRSRQDLVLENLALRQQLLTVPNENSVSPRMSRLLQMCVPGFQIC